MQQKTIDVLERNYLRLVEVANDLYAEGEIDLQLDNYNEASLLESQGDRVFEQVAAAPRSTEGERREG